MLASNAAQCNHKLFVQMVLRCVCFRPLRVAVSTEGWVMPLIHGYWKQRSLALAAQNISISLIARRSKYFAGTRYRKRGTNDQGYVANDVETEQVKLSSMGNFLASLFLVLPDTTS